MILNEVRLDRGGLIPTPQQHSVKKANEVQRRQGCRVRLRNLSNQRDLSIGFLSNDRMEIGEAGLFLRVLPKLVEMFDAFGSGRMPAEQLQR